MLSNVPSLAQLLKTLQQVPCLASKNIYRVATHFLQMDNEKLKNFCKILQKAKDNVEHCQICFTWCEKGHKCSFCFSVNRDQSIICVVELWQELLTIERTGGYNGVYHVLGGVICPLDGVGPEDLAIEQLVKRMKKGVKEVILATNQTPEGEATASFIASKLKDKSVTISCLARGIPVGSSLEFIDRLTIYKALSERRLF